MKYRQKALLYLIKVLHDDGKKVTKTFLDKLLFVAFKETTLVERPFYNFYPHYFGPFSDSFYEDFKQLSQGGYLNGFEATTKGIEAAEAVRKKDQRILDQLGERFENPHQAVDYVYAHYPEYTVKSRLIHTKVPEARPGIFSIGYQGKDSDSFLDVLIRNQIQEVIDVRANPFSMNFAFVKSRLTAKLEKVGMIYRHLPELGIDGALRREHLADNDYTTLFQIYSDSILPQAQKQVEELVALGSKRRIALLCFERDLNCCHRGILSRKIEQLSGKKVVHL